MRSYDEDDGDEYDADEVNDDEDQKEVWTTLGHHLGIIWSLSRHHMSLSLDMDMNMQMGMDMDMEIDIC